MDLFDSANSNSSGSSSSSSSYDFVKGFITGQVALLSLILLMVRLLFFRSAGAVITPTTIKLDSRIFPMTKRKAVSLDKSIVDNDSDGQLLLRLFGLDHQLLKAEAVKQGHPEVLISDESARWLTFLVAKLVIDPVRRRLEGEESSELKALLESRILSKLQMAKSVSLDRLDFKTFTMGPNYPQIDSYQLVYDAQREVCAFRVRCSWQQVFEVEVESAVQLGNLVALPFVLSAQAKQLCFTTQLQLCPHAQHLEIFCLPDDNFLLELEIGSLVGHRTKLKDLPKITAGIVEIIKKVLSETLIYPRSLRIPLGDGNLGLLFKGAEDGSVDDSLDGELDKVDEVQEYEQEQEDNTSLHSAMTQSWKSIRSLSSQSALLSQVSTSKSLLNK